MSAVIQEPGNEHAAASGFRPASVYDIVEILAIERAAYEFPWSEGLLRDCIENGYYFCLMIEQGIVVGYGIMSCVLDEAHILNLCIAPDWQGNGLGKRLLFHLLDVARKHRVETAFLEVRFSNEVAQNLYETNGFNQLGVRKDYYPKGASQEHALIYAKTL